MTKPTYRIGIDLGGTNIVAGVMNDKYEIVAKFSTPTLADRPYTEVVKDMAMAVTEAMKEAGITLDQCASLGIGSPGTCDSAKGTIVYANNLHWSDVPLREELNKYLDIPVYISNDANCAALGEVEAGSAKGKQNVIMVTLGTGVGGGIIIDGKIFSGQNSAGAEIGHALLVMDGVLCTCGRKGCVEAYASATGLIRMTKEKMDEYPDSVMHEITAKRGHVSGRTAFEAQRMGDEAGDQVVKYYVRCVAEGLIDLINIFRPEVIILGGGISNEGPGLFDPLRAYINENCYGGLKTDVPGIIPAVLGNDAGIIGAACLSE